jgi:hypothetical protein
MSGLSLSVSFRSYGPRAFLIAGILIAVPLSRILAKGVEIVLAPREGGGPAFFFVNDNSGNSFEFMQRR